MESDGFSDVENEPPMPSFAARLLNLFHTAKILTRASVSSNTAAYVPLVFSPFSMISVFLHLLPLIYIHFFYPFISISLTPCSLT